MIHPSQVVSIHPYFKVKPGNLDAVKALLEKFIASTSAEEANLYYHFTLNEDLLFCREAYVGAEGLLKHLDNVGSHLQEILKLADVVRVEVHGSAPELEKLKGPLAALNPAWFVFQSGVNR
jgi:quinol monooxygenase YgiN